MDDPCTAKTTESRPAPRPWPIVLETCGWIAGVGVLAVLLTAACESNTDVGVSTVVAEAQIGDEKTQAAGPEAAVANETDESLGAEAESSGEVEDFDTRLGGDTEFRVEVNSAGDLELVALGAKVSTEQTLCFVSTVTDFRSLFQDGSVQLEKDCGEGTIELTYQSSIQVDDQAPLVILDGTASIDCDDATVTAAGMGPFVTAIPNFRYGYSFTKQTFDALTIPEGAAVTLRVASSAEASLATRPLSSHIEITSQYEVIADYGLTQVPCATECTTDLDCPPTLFCEAFECVTPRFASDPLNLVLNSNPDTLTAGQPFALGFALDAYAGDLQLYQAEISLPLAALDYSGIAATNQGVAGCTIGPITTPVLTTVDPNEVYLDRNANASPDPNDPTLEVDEAAGTLTFTATVPNGGDGSATSDTLPADATVSCSGFFGLLTPGAAGTHQLTATFTSVDPTSGGANDGIGLAPLTRTFTVTFDSAAFALDRDGDGVFDDLDACPDDPDKTSPGLCGCGVDDATDGGSCDTGNPGRCQLGTRTCAGGGSACVQNFQPTDETCNGLDDDCNAIVDDDDPGGGFPCQTGQQGVCSEGTTECAGAAGVFCNRNDEPSEERCNGVDDDCDGGIDDELDCATTPFASLKGKVGLSAKADKDAFALQGVAPATGLAFDPPADGVVVKVEQGQQVILELAIAPGAGWKRNKKNDAWTFKDDKLLALGDPATKDAFSLKLNTKKQLVTAKVAVQKADLPTVVAGDVTITITTGNDRLTDTQAWIVKSKGKAVTTP